MSCLSVPLSFTLMTALLLAAVALAPPDEAAAQAKIVLRRPVIITLVPPGEIVADGSPQSLLFVVTDESGGLARDVSFRGTTASIGQLGSWQQLGPGVFTASYSVPPGTPRQEAQLTIKAKVGAAQTGKIYGVTVVPQENVRFGLQATPERIVLGQDASSVLTFTATGPSGEPLDGLYLAVGASVGTVSEVKPMGGGIYRAEYTPPETKRPGLTILSVVDMAHPETAVGFFPLQLWGAVDWKLNTGVPNANVGMDVAGMQFGPVAADAAGEATIPILVPPGVATATAMAIQEDGSTANPVTVDLKPPPFRRLKLAPVASVLPGDGVAAYPIYIFALGPDANPLANAPIQIHANHGGIVAVNTMGPGMYQAIYVPPAAMTPMREKVSISLAGTEKIDLEAVEFDVVPGLPKALAFTTDPLDVEAGEKTVALNGEVSTAVGTLPSGVGVAFASQEVVIPMEQDLGDGTFAASLTRNFESPFALSAEVTFPASERPVESVVAWPVMDQVLVNGKMPIVAMALDRYGLPVSGANLTATALNNTGTVTGGGTTDHNGRVVLEFTATPLPGMAVVQITDGIRTFSCPLWQTETLLIGLQFPLHGGGKQVRAMAAWGALRGRLIVGPGAPKQAPAAVAGAGPSAGADGTAGEGEPAVEEVPWWEMAGSAESGTESDPAAVWSGEIRHALTTTEPEQRAMRSVEVVSVDGGKHDIVVHYSHAATVIKVAGQTVQLEPEAWFSGWAMHIAAYTKSSSMKSNNFKLVNDDNSKSMMMSTANCRKAAGYSEKKRLDYVKSHVTKE